MNKFNQPRLRAYYLKYGVPLAAKAATASHTDSSMNDGWRFGFVRCGAWSLG